MIVSLEEIVFDKEVTTPIKVLIRYKPANRFVWCTLGTIEAPLKKPIDFQTLTTFTDVWIVPFNGKHLDFSKGYFAVIHPSAGIKAGLRPDEFDKTLLPSA